MFVTERQYELTIDNGDQITAIFPGQIPALAANTKLVMSVVVVMSVGGSLLEVSCPLCGGKMSVSESRDVWCGLHTFILSS